MDSVEEMDILDRRCVQAGVVKSVMRIIVSRFFSPPGCFREEREILGGLGTDVRK
jgi:hypothetical protein